MFSRPESLRWLAKKSRWEQAQKVLTRIRNLPSDHAYISWELEAIRLQIESEAERASRSFIVKIKEIVNTDVRKRLLIGMALMLFQNLSGINALNYYSPSIFRLIGFQGTSAGLLATGLFGVVKASMTAIFMIFAVDRVGRRPAMLLGSAGAILAMFYLGTYSKVSGFFEGHATRDGGAYVAIVMVYISAIFYAFSCNGILWIFW